MYDWRVLASISWFGSQPTSVLAGQRGFRRFSGAPFSILEAGWEPKREPTVMRTGHADCAWYCCFCWLKIAFIVVAPVVMTGLSW